MISVATLAEKIGIPVKDWPGNCSAIARAALQRGILRHGGRFAYGNFIGKIAPSSRFAGRPFTHHAWIALPVYDPFLGKVWDPTRWVFEDVEPYIFCGPATDYDYGGNRLHEQTMGPCPSPTDVPPGAQGSRWMDKVRLDLSGGTATIVTGLVGGLTMTRNQAHWLANYPLHLLGVHAKPLYIALKRARMEAHIPQDNVNWVLRHNR